MINLLKRLLNAVAPATSRGLPRFPHSRTEAQRVRRRWDRLNGRYYFIAELSLINGVKAAAVTFDLDTNVAVQVGAAGVEHTAFLGEQIDQLHITRVTGKGVDALVPCPSCGALLLPADVLSAAMAFWKDIDVMSFRCSACRGIVEIRIQPDQMHVGYTYGGASPHFSRVLTVVVPGLLRRVVAESLEVELGPQSWVIAPMVETPKTIGHDR